MHSYRNSCSMKFTYRKIIKCKKVQILSQQNPSSQQQINKMGKKQELKSKKKSKMKTSTNLSFRFHLAKSQYSNLFSKYMYHQYPSVQLLIKKIIKLPFCSQYYLKYPLEGMLKGVSKKLLLNTYEMTIYAYFLSLCKWSLDSDIFGGLYQLFPDIIHVNQPTDPQKLKELSMYLYFSSYSIKQLLNQDMQMFKIQMQKIFPQFEHLHAYWVNSQPTTNFPLDPKLLNEFYKMINMNENYVDYNVIIDKIIQISPCYDIAITKNNKIKSQSQILIATQQKREFHSEQQLNESQLNRQIKQQFHSGQDDALKILGMQFL